MKKVSQTVTKDCPSVVTNGYGVVTDINVVVTLWPRVTLPTSCIRRGDRSRVEGESSLPLFP